MPREASTTTMGPPSGWSGASGASASDGSDGGDQDVRCMHPRAQPRRRPMGVGLMSVWEQCPDCGLGLKAIKKETFSAAQLDALPLYDTDLQDRLYKERWEARQEARVTAQEQRNGAWWDTYHAYVASDTWRWTRQRVLTRDEGVCQGCRARQASDVHHLTYDHLGEEFLWELMSVCRECHERLHGHEIGV